MSTKKNNPGENICGASAEHCKEPYAQQETRWSSRPYSVSPRARRESAEAGRVLRLCGIVWAFMEGLDGWRKQHRRHCNAIGLHRPL